ncbi:unnamed protein product, partial [Mesorhabditis spiculigera]
MTELSVNVVCQDRYSQNEDLQYISSCYVGDAEKFLRDKRKLYVQPLFDFDFEQPIYVREAFIDIIARKKGRPCNETCVLTPLAIRNHPLLSPSLVDVRVCLFLNNTLNQELLNPNLRCVDSSRSGFDVLKARSAGEKFMFHDRVPWIDRHSLENYTKHDFDKEMRDLKKKPWIPVKRIKEELTNCLHMKYGSISENDFMYDKGIYGWMNVMKFSCALVGEHFYAFGMAFSKTRFRLKQILLKRQQRKHISTLYPKKFDHTPLVKSKVHQFNSIALNVKTRVMLLKPTEISNTVENFSKDLSDEACEILDDCRKEFCMKNDTIEYEYVKKNSQHTFFKERAGIARLGPQESLMMYTIAKPTFKFEIVKRSTSKGLIDLEQKYDHSARELFKEMMEQQFSHEFHMHHGVLLD